MQSGCNNLNFLSHLSVQRLAGVYVLVELEIMFELLSLSQGSIQQQFIGYKMHCCGFATVDNATASRFISSLFIQLSHFVEFCE